MRRTETGNRGGQRSFLSVTVSADRGALRKASSYKVNWYRIKTAFIGLKRLATLPEEDKQACVDAYKFFQRMQEGEKTETADETKAVADYYKVLNNLLSVFDLEKLYIPPMLAQPQIWPILSTMG